MTARQVYEGVLIELNKVNAPSLLLEDFNYLFNKAINQYINKKYNVYDVNQQSTDDLRVLKSTAVLYPQLTTAYGQDLKTVTALNSLYGATYEVNLPSDYLHILNCICTYRVKKQFKCYDKDTYVQFPAFRLTSDLWSQVINNFYMKPSYKRPYYFVHSVGGVTTDPHKNTNDHKDYYDQKAGYHNQNNPIHPYEYATEGNKNASDATGFGPGYDATVNTIRQQFFAFVDVYTSKYNYTKNFDNAGNVSVTVDILNFGQDSDAYALTDLHTAKTYGVVYNRVKKNFELAEVETITAFVEDGVLDITGNVEVLESQEILAFKDPIEYGGPYILVTPNFLEKHGDDINFAGLPRTQYADRTPLDLVEKEASVRYGNPSRVRLEVRYGKDSSLFELASVYIDYVKTPQFIRLTQEQIDLTEDMSQIMEFPDYVCQEIINELTHIVMENSGDQRLQTHPVVSQSIANPAQAQAQS